jgi:hypothetical protein
MHPAGGELAAWLMPARISDWPTVASNVLAGATLAGVLEPSREVGLLVAAMVAFYLAAMLLNDMSGHRLDRPLVVGAVSQSAMLTATIVLFSVAGVLLLLVDRRAFVSGVVLCGLMVAYHVWRKNSSPSPLVTAACHLMVYVTAFVGLAGPLTATVALAAGAIAAYLVGLTVIARTDEDGLQGPRVWPAVLCFVPAVYWLTAPDTLAPLVGLALVTWVASCMRLIYRPEHRHIRAAVGRLSAGISLVDAILIAAQGAAPLFVGAAVAAFLLSLLLWRSSEAS